MSWHLVDGWRWERLMRAEEGVIGYPALLQVTPIRAFDFRWRAGEAGAGRYDKTEYVADVTLMLPESVAYENRQHFGDLHSAQAWAAAHAQAVAKSRARAAALRLMDALTKSMRKEEEPWTPAF